MKWFVVAGLAVAIALVAFVAPHADSDPDGLERVAADHGLDAGTQPHDLAGSPLAEYGVRGIDDASVGTALAGLAGVLIVFLAMYLLARLAAAAAVRRAGTGTGPDEGAPVASNAPAP